MPAVRLPEEHIEQDRPDQHQLSQERHLAVYSDKDEALNLPSVSCQWYTFSRDFQAEPVGRPTGLPSDC